eukprot:755482-Hanusia_phi.AAC.5
MTGRGGQRCKWSRSRSRSKSRSRSRGPCSWWRGEGYEEEIKENGGRERNLHDVFFIEGHATLPREVEEGFRLKMLQRSMRKDRKEEARSSNGWEEAGRRR